MYSKLKDCQNPCLSRLAVRKQFELFEKLKIRLKNLDTSHTHIRQYFKSKLELNSKKSNSSDAKNFLPGRR